MKKNITKNTKKTTPAKAAKKPSKQIPWEERRNDVLAKARAKLRETIAAGKAALENVNAASKEPQKTFWSDKHTIKTLAIRVNKTGDILGSVTGFKNGTDIEIIRAHLMKVADGFYHLAPKSFKIIPVTINY